MPGVALRRRYAGLHVCAIISVTLISVTFYRYGNAFLTFSFADNGNNIWNLIDLFSSTRKNHIQ
jgi:hypothetical protein